MKLEEWLKATSPHGCNTEAERAAREAERDRVLKAAQTSLSTLRNAVCRGRVGDKLLYRLAAATKEEKNRILVSSERPEP